MKHAFFPLIASLSLLASGCRSGMRIQPKEVLYSEIEGTSLSMDIYQPPAAAGAFAQRC